LGGIPVCNIYLFCLIRDDVILGSNPGSHVIEGCDEDKERSTLTIYSIPTSLAGVYKCVAENVAGNAKCSARIMVTGTKSLHLYIPPLPNIHFPPLLNIHIPPDPTRIPLLSKYLITSLSLTSLDICHSTSSASGLVCLCYNIVCIHVSLSVRSHIPLLC